MESKGPPSFFFVPQLTMLNSAKLTKPPNSTMRPAGPPLTGRYASADAPQKHLVLMLLAQVPNLSGSNQQNNKLIEKP